MVKNMQIKKKKTQDIESKKVFDFEEFKEVLKNFPNIKVDILDSYLNIKLFFDFLEEFRTEGDRSAVILGTAKLDYLLRQLITKNLLHSTTTNDELLDGDSPLSTFSAKIKLCYRLGLIDRELVWILNLIRKIRNDFAHAPAECNLDSGPNKNRVDELVRNYKVFTVFRGMKVYFPECSESSVNFRVMLAMIIVHLETRISMTNTLKPIDMISMTEILKSTEIEFGKPLNINANK